MYTSLPSGLLAPQTGLLRLGSSSRCKHWPARESNSTSQRVSSSHRGLRVAAAQTGSLEVAIPTQEDAHTDIKPRKKKHLDEQMEAVVLQTAAKLSARIKEGMPKLLADAMCIREVLLTAVSYVPEVGSPLKYAVGAYWKDTGVSMVDSIKKEVSTMIDDKLVEDSTKNLKGTMNGWVATFQRYFKLSDNNLEKDQMLTTLMASADGVFGQLKEGDNQVHMLGVAMPFAVLHLMLFRERVERARILKLDTTDRMEDLDEQYKKYMQYFQQGFALWKNWRSDKIEARGWSSYWGASVCGTALDRKGGGEVKFELSELLSKGPGGGHGDDYFAPCFLLAKQQMMGEQIALMGSLLSPHMLLHHLIPGSEGTPLACVEGLQSITLGPYCAKVHYKSQVGGLQTGQWTDTVAANEHACPQGAGRLTKVRVWQDEAIAGLQLVYDNGVGVVAKHPDFEASETAYRELELDGRWVTGMELSFDLSFVVGIQLLFSDGTRSDHLGTRHPQPVTFQCDPSYELTSVGWAVHKRSKYDDQIELIAANDRLDYFQKKKAYEYFDGDDWWRTHFRTGLCLLQATFKPCPTPVQVQAGSKLLS